MCLWDLCAICGLAKTVGGVFAHLDGAEIDFSSNGEVDVTRGFILGRTPEVVSEYVEAWRKFKDKYPNF